MHVQKSSSGPFFVVVVVVSFLFKFVFTLLSSIRTGSSQHSLLSPNYLDDLRLISGQNQTAQFVQHQISLLVFMMKRVFLCLRITNFREYTPAASCFLPFTAFPYYIIKYHSSYNLISVKKYLWHADEGKRAPS